MKLLRLLIAGPAFLVGVLLALYGLLGLMFNEPSGGSTYVTLAGHELDAHLVGAVSLVIGLAVIAAAVVLMRRGRLRS